MRLARVEAFPAASGALDLEVHRGEIVLLRGPNGSGKTSLLRSLAALEAPMVPTRVERLAKIAFATQDPRDGLVGLTVRGEARLRGIALPMPLASWADRDVATLSSGEARRVGLGVASGSRPSLLLLDEPTEGLDAGSREALRALVAEAAQEGAVVAADHAGLIGDLATRVVDLGPSGPAEWPAIPRRDGAPVVTASAAAVRRDGREIPLPALALGPGLHAVGGPNGSGKSTLLLHLAGVLEPRGVLVRERAPRPGLDARLALPCARDALHRGTVEEELAGAEPEISDGLVARALRSRHPWALSGGEAQRVSLAKTLGAAAPLYLLDEPEAHLDAEGRHALATAIAARVDEGACVLVATHDAALSARAQSRIELEASR